MIAVGTNNQHGKTEGEDVPNAVVMTRGDEDKKDNFVSAGGAAAAAGAMPTYAQSQHQGKQQDQHQQKDNKINSRDPVRAYCDVCEQEIVTDVKLSAGTDLYDATHTCPRCNHVIGKKKVIAM